ncbi:DNA polymerase III subunit delta [uncultured Oscillibacter sp.]|uniref:DNA polymerase III subunit delta n=1 Tax=uncultured Oscillibacter sp. TaxID=876091 RepID=UPI0025EC5E4E|nr:DNA polymerase III subunit delta [uncultured Oscillibacter sp.]
MADKRRAPRKGEALQKLKADLSAGSVGNAYIFYGEESYLREHYLGQLREALIPPGSETFNCHALEGKDLTAESLAETAEAMPMMAERTLAVVTDWDLFKLGEDQRGKLIALLEDLPPYCCLVFVYDTLEFKPNRSQKKLCGALERYVETVEFPAASSADLLPWISRRFKALGKEIGRQEAEHLVFTCGGLMTGLVPEIEKIAAYAKGGTVTRADIDAVADPVLLAEVFKLSDAVLQGRYDQAASILGDLLKMQTEPIMILAALGSQLRRIWTARLALDSGRDRYWLMELWGMKSDYPAKLLLAAARRTTPEWCAQAVRRCQELDRRMKSERGMDSAGGLKLLLVQLAAGRAVPPGGR